MSNRKLHDGIIGIIIAAATYLGMTSSEVLLYIPIFIGVLMFLSMLTGFCPVYFILEKMRPGK